MGTPQKVLFIILDQCRADCISGELAGYINTPNIDALRREAVTFNRHYSVANPCGPSRASIFTGRYAMNHRSVRNGTPLAHDMPNIAREIRKSGYDPLLFGYTDTSVDPRLKHPNDPGLKTEEGLLPGFREMLEMRLMESYPWRAHLKSQGYKLPDYADIYNSVSPDPNRPARPDDPPFYRAEHSDTAFLTDRLLHDLDVRTDQNWFALATYIRPHPPLVAPEPYNKMYADTNLPPPHRMETSQDEIDVHPFLKAALDAPDMNKIVRGCKDHLEGDADVQMLRSIYLGLLTEVDAHIGRIIAFLKDSGQYDDTLIILTADHGEMLGDHHMWGKQTLFEQAYHIPLIIRDPRNPAQFGSETDAFSETVDVMPTILSWLGQPAPSSVDGTSLGPFLRGETPADWRDYVVHELDFAEPDKPTIWQKATGTGLSDSNLAILREERFKLVHFNGGLPPLLYDLKNDRFEMNNLANDPAHTATLIRLTQKLMNHWMSRNDRTLTGIKITANGAFGYGT